MTVDLGWTLQEAAGAAAGTLVGADAPVRAVTTDSRAAHPGDLFVALTGERFDGHAFTEAAHEAGVAAVMVDAHRGVAGRPRIEVADTSTALRDLAVYRRRQLDLPTVAITGSSGKTSTKDLLASILDGSWASPRSYNNEVGVPLTVLGTPRGATALVLEVGSRGKGHIAWLMPAVRPDVAVVTNLGVVHLETFGTEEGLADAKFELVESLDDTGTAVIPVDEPRLHRPHRGDTLTFGLSRGDVAVHDLTLDQWGRASFTLATPTGTQAARLGIAGAHQALNAAAAVAAGLALGRSLDSLTGGLERAVASPWRMEIHRGAYTVVNDAYNANPDSVEAALRTVIRLPGRPVAVLGHMAELGPVEEAEHLRIGALAAELGFAEVIVVGHDPGIARGAGTVATTVDDPAEAPAAVKRRLRPGDTVLVKASRAVGLERLAQDLIEEGRG